MKSAAPKTAISKSALSKSAVSKYSDKLERIERSMMGAALVAAVLWAVMPG